jgi:hypothetical protein
MTGAEGKHSNQERPSKLKLAHDKSNSNNRLDRTVAAELYGEFAGEESAEGLFKLLYDPEEVVANKAKEVLLRPDYVKDLINAEIDFVKKAGMLGPSMLSRRW